MNFANLPRLSFYFVCLEKVWKSNWNCYSYQIMIWCYQDTRQFDMEILKGVKICHKLLHPLAQYSIHVTCNMCICILSLKVSSYKHWKHRDRDKPNEALLQPACWVWCHHSRVTKIEKKELFFGTSSYIISFSFINLRKKKYFYIF